MQALLADVGGTNSRFLYSEVTRDMKLPKPLLEKKIPTKSKKHFDDIVQNILESIQEKGLPKPKYAFLALPGPITNKSQSGEIANCGWDDNKVNAQHLKEKFGFEVVILLNDFESIGLAMCIIENDQLDQISGENPRVSPKFIIGPGTGLGYCMLVPTSQENDGGRYLVWPGEGGHQIFLPKNEIELEFLNFMKQKSKTNFINLEQVCAGQSISHLYQFLRGKSTTESELEKVKSIETITNQDIISWGTSKKDPVCTSVVNMQISMLANEIASQMIRILPFGGVFLVGSLALALHKYIQENKEEVFQVHFKGRDLYNDILSKVPVYIVKYEDLGLLGAFEESKRFFVDHEMI